MKNATTNRPTYLYRCYDCLGVLLYVGITDNPERRMSQHAAEKFWWTDVAKTTNMAFETREQALWAEWAVITTCHPLHNLRSSVPTEHRCLEVVPRPPTLPFDGYIYVTEKLAEVKANAGAYEALHQRIDDIFAEAGVSGPSPWPTD